MKATQDQLKTKNKSTYEKPTAEVVVMLLLDVITSSGGNGNIGEWDPQNS